jgi:hypothetical protein
MRHVWKPAPRRCWMTRTAMLEKGAPTVETNEPAGRAPAGVEGRPRSRVAPTGDRAQPPSL